MADEKWDALLNDLRSALHDVATIVSHVSGGRPCGFVQADFHPADDAWTRMSLVCLGATELLLSYGDGPARWELDWADEDVKFIKDVVRAVCTGNSKEIHGPGRVHVEVLLPNGSTVKTSTYEVPGGLVPLPGWKKGRPKT
jgi:hypothetical protein